MKNKIYDLNLMGLKCPIPVLRISKKFKEINKGDILIVNADDPKAEDDIVELSKNIKIKLLERNVKKGNKIFFKLKKY
ncbi:MAG: sulfurtransferase TusA family protein [Pseudomonadota bacterium]|nr:sulfurtransferase TusA family protein [Pseudomonadota bacterium]